MASQRIFLWSALALVLWLNYQAWTHDYHPPVAPTQESAAPSGTVSAPVAPGLDANVPTPQRAPAQTAGSPAPGAAPSVPTPSSEAAPSSGGDKIHVRTDVLDMDISLRGGQLTRADLLEYPLHKKQPQIKVRLFNDEPEQPLYVLQSGLTAEGNGGRPDHLAVFTAPATEYALDGQEELKIPLSWSNDAGITVAKTYTFRRGSYAVHIDYSVDNHGTAAWSGASYLQILRQQHKVERSMFNVESYAFAGPAVYDGTRYRKLKIDDEEDRNLNLSVTDGWLASMQHHFVAAVSAGAKQPYQFRLQVKGDEYLFSAVGPVQSVPPGGHTAFNETVFVGPKLQAQLEHDRAATGACRRLRQTHLHRQAAIRTSELGAWPGWQLGLVDHHRHRTHQVALLLAQPGERQVDGQDAQPHSAHQEYPGALQGRSRAAWPRDDGALQAREGKPTRRLHADRDPDPGISSRSTGCC